MKKVILVFVILVFVCGCNSKPSREIEINKLRKYLLNNNYVVDEYNDDIYYNGYGFSESEKLNKSSASGYIIINVEELTYSYSLYGPSDNVETTGNYKGKKHYISYSYTYSFITNIITGGQTSGYYNPKTDMNLPTETYEYVYNLNSGTSECSHAKASYLYEDYVSRSTKREECSILNIDFAMPNQRYLDGPQNFINILNEAKVNKELLK